MKGDTASLDGKWAAPAVVADEELNEHLSRCRRDPKNGKHYHRAPGQKGRFCGGVNTHHAIEDIVEYMKSTDYVDAYTAIDPTGGHAPNLGAV
eukprot:4116192-Alexandrium_andersonii.AAC.1